MLLNYKFQNFKGFKDSVEFSMIAAPGKVKKRYPYNYVALGNGYDVLKTAVIVGENAGGKTSFVESLEYLKFFFTRNQRVFSFPETVNSNNRLNDCFKQNDSKQVFEIEISDQKNENVVYHYYLEIDEASIIAEKLFIRSTKRSKEKLVFHYEVTERSVECQDNYPECAECLSHMKNIKTVCHVELGNMIPESVHDYVKHSFGNEKQLGLNVARLAIMGVREAIEFVDIINEQLIPESPAFNLDIDKSIRSDESELKILSDKRFFEIFRMVDYSIFKIEIDDKKPFQESLVYRRNKDGKEFSRKIQSDSSGVREFFAWAINIFRVVYEDKIVIADEMDRVLNPVLSDRIIAFINGHDHQGQFIFTTHNVLHLDLNTYMKEQIYFVSKDKETLESEFYSLADFPDIRYEVTKIYEFYMKGILGGTSDE